MIIEPLNLVFNVVFLVHAAMAGILLVILKHRTKAQQLKALWIVSIILSICYLLYKGLLVFDMDYIEYSSVHYGGMNLLNELPLNPCGLALFLFPFAYKKGEGKYLDFCVLLSFWPPLLALLMPTGSSFGTPFFTIHNIGFYFVHFALFFLGIVTAMLGLYHPRYRDLPWTLVNLAVLAFFVFLANVLLRATGLNERANFFYTMEPDGNFILEFFHGLIPVPFVYAIPFVLIWGLLCLLHMTAYKGIERLVRAAGGNSRSHDLR